MSSKYEEKWINHMYNGPVNEFLFGYQIEGTFGKDKIYNGTIKLINGIIYEGTWENNMFTRGSKKCTDGTIYEGKWKKMCLLME